MSNPLFLRGFVAGVVFILIALPVCNEIVRAVALKHLRSGYRFELWWR